LLFKLKRGLIIFWLTSNFFS